MQQYFSPYGLYSRAVWGYTMHVPGERYDHCLQEVKDMSWIFSVALGVGIGYFAFQALKQKNDLKQDEEYETGENKTEETTRSSGINRLCKSATDRKLAGVCGGIAEYFGVDSTIIRLVFALLVVGWGTGIMAYIIAALVMPKAQDA